MINTLRLHSPLPILCRVLTVSASGYHAWRKRPPSRGAMEEARLEVEIKAAHRRTRETYGPERLQRDLAAHGVHVGRHRIKRLRRKLGLRCRQKRRFKATTNSGHTLPVAENLLAQDFAGTAPGLVWLTDITYISTREGWLYLAGHKALYTHEIVGYAMAAAHDQTPGLPIPAARCGGQEAGARTAASFGPRQPVLRPYVQELAEPLRDACLDERQGQLLRQRPHGKFLGHAEDRTRFSSALRNPAAGYAGDHGIHRTLLQPATAAEAARLPGPGGL